jgi:hypothetical protein
MSPASYQTAPPRDVVPIFSTCPSRAGNGTRTRDPNLGKVVLYQLSYSREPCGNVMEPAPDIHRCCPAAPLPRFQSGGEGDRTPDLVNAIHALSQLSYAPCILSRPRAPRQHENLAAGRGSVKRILCGTMRIY